MDRQDRGAVRASRIRFRLIEEKCPGVTDRRVITESLDVIQPGRTTGEARGEREEKERGRLHGCESSGVTNGRRRVHESIGTQGPDKVLVEGQAGVMTIEMWVNTATRAIETAYPVPDDERSNRKHRAVSSRRET